MAYEAVADDVHNEDLAEERNYEAENQQCPERTWIVLNKGERPEKSDKHKNMKSANGDIGLADPGRRRETAAELPPVSLRLVRLQKCSATRHRHAPKCIGASTEMHAKMSERTQARPLSKDKTKSQTFRRLTRDSPGHGLAIRVVPRSDAI